MPRTNCCKCWVMHIVRVEFVAHSVDNGILLQNIIIMRSYHSLYEGQQFNGSIYAN